MVPEEISMCSVAFMIFDGFYDVNVNVNNGTISVVQDCMTTRK